MNNKLRLISRFTAAVAIACFGLAGCADEDGDDTTDGGGTDTMDSTTAGSSDSMTTADTMTAGSMTTAGTTGMTTTGMTTMDTATTEPAADGESCMMDAECMSGQCFVVGVLGGICGECNEDADCDSFGCSIPNPLADPPQGSSCGDGMVGSGCETADACSGDLICATILDVPGVFTASTCSECDSDMDCDMGTVCNPTVSVTMLTGNKVCVTPGSIEDGNACDLEAQNGACQNFCESADVMGLLELGVCSECSQDADCPTMGDMCEPPAVDLAEGLIAGACVTPE